MRLLRPYIPIAVRAQVVCRQFGVVWTQTRTKWHLDNTLRAYYGDKSFQLDHDPALENRIKVFDDNGKLTGYIPAANDPEYLIYREKHAHHIKTNVRGDGAQYSDRALANRERARNRQKEKYKWPSRPFPKGRKMSLSSRLNALRKNQK